MLALGFYTHQLMKRMAVTHCFSLELEINVVECLLQLLYGLASASYLVPIVRFRISPFLAWFSPS
jgi:hypothetical protein